VKSSLRGDREKNHPFKQVEGTPWYKRVDHVDPMIMPIEELVALIVTAPSREAQAWLYGWLDARCRLGSLIGAGVDHQDVKKSLSRLPHPLDAVKNTAWGQRVDMFDPWVMKREEIDEIISTSPDAVARALVIGLKDARQRVAYMTGTPF
jgi:hypothetical protein